MRSLYGTLVILFLVALTQSYPSREYRNVPMLIKVAEPEMTNEEAQLYCTTKLRWLKPHQKKKCQQYPKKTLKSIMVTIQRGVSMALTECEQHFSDHRWNCSGINAAQFFQDEGILKTDTRESAYVFAITSAGVAFALTRQCDHDNAEMCGCDTRVRGKASKEGEKPWQWGGCSANIKYGDEVSKNFMDPDSSKKDVRDLLAQHNNEAGRKALRDNMGKDCRCHGVSGSCSVRICWRKMPPFNAVAQLLRKEFDRSQRVRANSSKTKLVKTNRAKRAKKRKRKRSRPSGTDLVYFKESPDFCQPNRKLGILGIRGRLCNKGSPGNDGCRTMCCGNGYNTIERSSKVQCECKFVWCCKVQCDICEKDWFDYRCK